MSSKHKWCEPFLDNELTFSRNETQFIQFKKRSHTHAYQLFAAIHSADDKFSWIKNSGQSVIFVQKSWNSSKWINCAVEEHFSFTWQQCVFCFIVNISFHRQRRSFSNVQHLNSDLFYSLSLILRTVLSRFQYIFAIYRSYIFTKYLRMKIGLQQTNKWINFRRLFRIWNSLNCEDANDVPVHSKTK